MSRNTRLVLSALFPALLLAGCGSKEGGDPAGEAGAGAAGAPIIERGGSSGSGGSGARPTGGGAGTGGRTSGGADNGGEGIGGETNGGDSAGGSASGGTAGGGADGGGAGGSPAGGAGSGGNSATGIMPIGGICANTDNCNQDAGAAECCDGICVFSEDCVQTGYLPCDSAAACDAYGGGKVCCEVNAGGEVVRFCTKPSGCTGTRLP